MHTQEASFDGTLWFMTSKMSAVSSEVERANDVLLTYAHPGSQSYIAINGTAEVIEDRAMIRTLWRPVLKMWFPEGADDPAICLIRVVVDRAEFWDSPSAPVRLFQFAKALVTGDQVEGGEHTTIKLP
jgi:general stress protein 26